MPSMKEQLADLRRKGKKNAKAKSSSKKVKAEKKEKPDGGPD